MKKYMVLFSCSLYHKSPGDEIKPRWKGFIIMIGIVCEKKSAAENFAKALGGKTGTYNGEPYLIVHASGHLFEYAPPEEQVAAD